MIFFFQAEDGIRDTSVTGVQTCALPIFPPERSVPHRIPGDARGGVRTARVELEKSAEIERAPRDEALVEHLDRKSVRVGKECTSGWWPCQKQRKQTLRVPGNGWSLGLTP